MNEGAMADHTPPLEPGRLPASDYPLLGPPPPAGMVNGDGPQQVILVQVNAGEAFTIRRDDGQFQCITGPAQVPMMSPNGSVPPIYVPPGYISQVIEENGVRRVLVLPQREFHPGSHSPLHPPSAGPAPPHSHLSTFIPHPAMLPQPLAIYPAVVSGAGDMASQFIPQYHALQFCEQDPHSSHARAGFVPRDERTSKTYDRLQKKIKERQGGLNKDKSGSPPSSPQKSAGRTSWLDGRNGTGKGQEPAAASRTTTAAKAELDEKSMAFQVLLSAISKPVVTDIQARSAVLTWSSPLRSDSGDGEDKGENDPRDPLSYEVTVSNTGKDGKYKTAYSGEDLTVTLEALRPATDYHARVGALCDHLQGHSSEAVSFTTLSCEPDTPAAPRKSSGNKNTILLQWKAPCDNGSKIQNYILQWDEGKGNGEFEQCYYGPQKQHRVAKLLPASKYTFRLAAKNDLGTSAFSEPISLFTSCSVPASPPRPALLKAGVTWLTLQWQRPASSPKDDDILYTLEMEEDGSGYGFKPKYDGEEVSYTIKNLCRSTKYKFRVIAYNTEGKSVPSQVAEFTTCPDRPARPGLPALKGRPNSHSFRLAWEAPKDDGGSEITKYSVEISEDTSEASWKTVYSGSALEHMCEGLKPGCTYQVRVSCISSGGQSPVSESLRVETLPVAPGPCLPPRVAGKPKARELQLRWGPPQVDGGSAVSCYSLQMACVQTEEYREVYQGCDPDYTVSGLLPGTAYSFKVRAGNKAGYGPLSEQCEVTTCPGAPEQCKVLQVACKSPTCAVIRWETPQCNGAPVAEYRLEWGAAEGSMQTCYSGPALSHEVRGLQPATYYFCRVLAVNAAGAGPFCEAATCQTPCSVPAAVSNIHALEDSELKEEMEVAGDGAEDGAGRDTSSSFCPSSCLGLRWDTPCDHGAEITSYCIDLGDRQPIVVGPVTRYIIQNLQPETSYRIRIQALNSLGSGPFSHIVRLKTKALPPLPPRLECAAISHQTLKLRWGDGSAKGSSDAVQYELQMEDKNGRFMSLYKGPCHTHKVQRLNESTSYALRIRALNEAGEGPFSDVYTFTTPLSPPGPLKAPRIDCLDDHSCDVSWDPVPPMKGDSIIYTLQCMMGNMAFKQVYKGSAASFRLSGLQQNTEYRFRVCAIRQCQAPSELSGPYSSAAVLSLQRSETAAGSIASGAGPRGPDAERPRASLTDEQCAALILVLFAVISILIAFVIQYFVIK
ncbi:fibronectin type-III domain-containing protein 3A-like [Brienomyrus brachyistius]|uniref:fibronectin type-III domain-containing protein 3A-like n=1 Tax=Brienomyrus brachyistius TaxID=42636 RepID=UPI0020B1C19D|nr:fibronectin type-III domain-containing protein 3A-like [Brienomyrus brachyistius]XP_048839384.1 fibronectin type-III domain-containing protein 3A-like [Brienomyrus brachyistius]